ncbi:MAG: aldo/keto reductase [Oscillospiraceae bacterium]|jgi:predicted aldo/keto reductase-like oxidoreductase|nr:aldo/keto reductase [Oscillospiraceae bacterium]
MSKVILGKTGIESDKNAFGALPIQRISKESAAKLLRKAAASGISYFDTARSYTDSEEKIGYALSGIRKSLAIATKTPAQNAADFWNDLETSLRLLKTDYIDVCQFHNPAFLPRPGDESGLYDAMLEAKAQGKIRHIGISNHRLNIAFEAVNSGLYETLQFPFSFLSGEKEHELVRLCKEKGVGFIAMKALSGGLITNSAAAYAWMSQFENVLPIWGIQRENELDEFLSYMKNPPVYAGELKAAVEKDRAELAGNFCRGCGYCLPCPAGIKINDCARISQLIRRAPSQGFLEESFQTEMSKIYNCINCGHCRRHCPYGLDTPELLRLNLKDYEEILAGKRI